MGFPRKKYVQRKSSPTTLIQHVFTTSSGNASGTTLLPSALHLMNSNGASASDGVRNCQHLSTILQQQMVAMQQQRQQQQQHELNPHQHHHQPQHQHQHHNGGPGHYVLVHRANVGAADNQAPRASSAPPVPQNQVGVSNSSTRTQLT